MPDRETVITHLQIIRTWASFAREFDLQFFTAKHLENIAQWSGDALALLQEQEVKMSVCDKCGLEHPADDRYCPRCGKSNFD